MNDTLIVPVYIILDDLLRPMRHRTDCRARTSDSEVLTVGVIIPRHRWGYTYRS